MYDEFLKFPELTEEEERIEQLESTVEMMDWELQWANISYERLERQKDISETQLKDLLPTVKERRKNAIRHNPRNPKWKPNAELLIDLGLPGHTIDVLFDDKDEHARRDLIIRSGIVLRKNTRRIEFAVDRYVKENIFEGELEGHKGKKALLGLNLNWMNKVVVERPNFSYLEFEVKTSFVDDDIKNLYLELERFYAPGGVGFSGYDDQDLLDAHNKIMAEIDRRRKAAE